MSDSLEANIEKIVDKLAEALLAKVPFGALIEGPLEEALNKVVEAAVTKVETLIEEKFHI